METEFRDGALLAQRDLKAKGSDVELFFEDNGGELAPSAIAGNKLINVNKVDATVSIISGVGKLLKPIAENGRILNIGICSDTDVADGTYSFINYLTAEQGVAKFVDHFSRTMGHSKSLSVLAMNESGFQKIVDELERQAAGKIALRSIEHFDKGATDFRPTLLRIKSGKPDALLILGLSPEIETIAKQARGLNIDLPLTSIEGFGLASDKTPFEGAWFVDSAVPDAEFRTRYSKTYGREVTPGVGHSYDSVMLLAEAWQRAQDDASSHDLTKEFRKLSSFDGAIGTLKVRSDGVIWSDASIKTIKNGEPVLLTQ